MKQIYVSSLDLLETGDIVFYRPMRDTRTMGWLYDKIKSCFYRSPYVYVGLLQQISGVHYITGANGLEILNSILEDRDVDIYRVTRESNVRLEYDAEDNKIVSHTYKFDGEFVAMKLREQFKKNPHWAYRIHFWIRQLFCNRFSNDEDIMKIVNCATALEYAFNEVGYDFCPRVSPNYATLDIISRSSLIDYLFTVKNDADQH